MALTKQQQIRAACRRLDDFVAQAEELPAGSFVRKGLLAAADLELDTLKALGLDGRTKAAKTKQARKLRAPRSALRA